MGNLIWNFAEIWQIVCLLSAYQKQIKYFSIHCTFITKYFSQKKTNGLAHITKHPKVFKGIFQGKIFDERQGKKFGENIIWTLKLLPAFFSGFYLSYSLRYDFWKIDIYLIQPRRNVLKKQKLCWCIRKSKSLQIIILYSQTSLFFFQGY